MRLYGRWHKRHRRCGNAAYCPRVIKVAGLLVAYGRVPLPPRGAALRQRRIGHLMTCTVMANEKYWRAPGNRVPRYKPRLHRWANWRTSQGFIGGKWEPSQLRKPNRKTGQLNTE